MIAGYDLETTGLLAPDHRIIELSVILYDEKGGKLESWTQRVNPRRSIDAKAQAVHKIAERDLRGEPDWEAVAPELTRKLEGVDLIVAHNGDDFDFPFTNQELVRVGLPKLTCATFDTMRNGRWATFNGKVPNLGELCFACGVDYDTAAAHAAEYDVDRMMECFFKARSWGFFCPQP